MFAEIQKENKKKINNKTLSCPINKTRLHLSMYMLCMHEEQKNSWNG